MKRGFGGDEQQATEPARVQEGSGTARHPSGLLPGGLGQPRGGGAAGTSGESTAPQRESGGAEHGFGGPRSAQRERP